MKAAYFNMHVPVANRALNAFILDFVNLWADAIFIHTRTRLIYACCVPESAARRVMEHALLNDESEYLRDVIKQ